MTRQFDRRSLPEADGTTRRSFLRTAAAVPAGAVLGSGVASASHENVGAHPAITLQDQVIDRGDHRDDLVTDIQQVTNIHLKGGYDSGSPTDDGDFVVFDVDLFTGAQATAVWDYIDGQPEYGDPVDQLFHQNLDVRTSDEDTHVYPWGAKRVGAFPQEEKFDGTVDVTGAGEAIIEQVVGELSRKVDWFLTAGEVIGKLAPIDYDERLSGDDSGHGFQLGDRYDTWISGEGQYSEVGHYATFTVRFPVDQDATVRINTGTNSPDDESADLNPQHPATQLTYEFHFEGPTLCSWEVEKTRSRIESSGYSPSHFRYPQNAVESDSGGGCYRTRKLPIGRSNEVSASDLHLPGGENEYMEVER